MPLKKHSFLLLCEWSNAQPPFENQEKTMKVFFKKDMKCRLSFSDKNIMEFLFLAAAGNAETQKSGKV